MQMSDFRRYAMHDDHKRIEYRYAILNTIYANGAIDCELFEFFEMHDFEALIQNMIDFDNMPDNRNKIKFAQMRIANANGGDSSILFAYGDLN